MLDKIQKVYKEAYAYDGSLILPIDVNIRQLDNIRNAWGLDNNDMPNWVFYGKDISRIDKSVMPELVPLIIDTLTKEDKLELRAYALKIKGDSVDAIPWIRYSKY